MGAPRAGAVLPNDPVVLARLPASFNGEFHKHFIFWNVSYIDHGPPEPEVHAGCITGQFFGLLPVTESVALPPDEAKHHDDDPATAVP
jgi:hypothetical protein